MNYKASSCLTHLVDSKLNLGTANRKKMPSNQEYISPFSLKGIRANPSVIPVVGCIVLGVAMAAAYTARLAIASPDVTWNPRKKRMPWNDYDKKEYKFITMEPFDPKTYEHPRPRF